jgi:phenylpropionate dioxygenase-like ring-hydroxylating dioxygenase large terminal subunit
MRAAKIHPIKQNGRGAREGLVNAREGLVSPRIFVDPEIYRQEQERIFTRTWLYVAHESEIPQSGDFVTRTMGEDSVIVARGADGKIRVFLNACRHRGMPVCREDMGKTSSFVCGYHGWRFGISGELIGVPFFEGYQGKLDKSCLGLHQAPSPAATTKERYRQCFPCGCGVSW